MPEDLSFAATRDRDAWASILGFLYQVELTVLRLIDLDENDLLELERGEDIDLIAGVVAPDVPKGEVVRILEQVKSRSRNLTLHTSSARTAVANFHSHRTNNQGRRLRFRFTTNADVSLERPSPFPDQVAGIDVWEALRRGGLEAGIRAARLGGVRQLLTTKVHPEGCPSDVWTSFQGWLETVSDYDLLSFVADFEWATLSPEPASLRQQIVQRLQTRGYATTSDEAELQCDRLVVTVLRILAQPGIKRLERSDLQRILRDGSMDSGVANVIRRIGDLNSEVLQIRGRVESVEQRLSILAPWAERARRLIDPSGDTQAFQHTRSYFGPRLDAASTFNHARPLAGRDKVLKESFNAVQGALATDSRVAVVIGGHAGVGKSRLLLEIAELLSQDGASVRWVRDEGLVPPGSAVELPDGPVVVICDDAHRCRDLQTVLAIGQQRTEPTVVVLGIRPWGRPALRVAALRANVAFDSLLDRGDLPDLDRQTLLELVRAELGAGFAEYADPLVRATQDSALVALVGARLLRARAIPPALLAHDAEFAYAVLGGFRDEVLGKLGDLVDHALARRVLEYVAALGPLLVADNNILENLAAALGKQPSEVHRAIAVLLDAGVLRQNDGRVRVVPDVLADHILADTLLAGGRSTGFEREVLKGMRTAVLPEFVRNLAELQWQFSETGQRVDVFSEAWKALLGLFRSSNNWERTQLIDNLTPVAVFQPAAVLRLCEWIADNVDALNDSEDASNGVWGVSWTAGSLMEKLPPLLRIVAQHEEHYDPAVDLLWRLGSRDKRATNPHPEHAIRVLDEIAAYSPRDHLWRKVKALGALRRWTAESDWARRTHSPLGVARALLATTIIQDEWNEAERTVTMTRLSINPKFGWEVRDQVIELLGNLALSTDARARIRALDELLKVLDPPEQQFAHVVTEEEEERWRPQYEKAFEQIERILAASRDPMVRIQIGDHLVWTAMRTTVKWKAEQANAVRRRIGETAAMTAVRVVAQRFPDHPGRGGWQEREVQASKLTQRFAEELAKQPDEEVIRFLVDTAKSIRDAGIDANVRPLLVALAQQRNGLAVTLSYWLLASKPGEDRTHHADWLPTLLANIRSADREAYHALLEAAVRHRQSPFRHAAAWALRWTAKDEDGWSSAETSAAKDLLQDDDLVVRATGVASLWFVPATTAGELLEVVDLQGNVELASVVSELWVMRRSTELPVLSVASASRLLDQLVEVPKLDDHRGGYGHLLAALAEIVPTKVVDLLVERTRREAAYWSHSGAPGYLRYEAVPYHGLPEVWQALKSSREYPVVVRRLRDSLFDVRDELADEMVDLIRSVVWWDSELEEAFREWIKEGDGKHLIALGPFLQGIGPTFVLEHRLFVGDLVAAATAAGAETEHRVVSALREGTSRSLRPVEAHPVGQADAVDERLATEGARIATTYPANSALRRLYEGIVADATERLEVDRRVREDGPLPRRA